jgi:hypothetical protein
VTKAIWEVFISHSSNKTSGVTARLRDLLADRLRPPMYDVFLDRERLKPGDEWEPQIRKRLQSANIGIVLVDAAALESDWVKEEASFLALTLKSELSVIPVYIGVQQAEAAGLVGLRRLKSRHYVKLADSRDPVKVEREAGNGLAQIMKRLAMFEEVLEFGEADLIRRLARLCGVDDDTAVQMCREYFHDAKAKDVLPLHSRHVLSKHLIDARISMPAVRAIETISDDIRPQSGPFYAAFSPTWVDLAQARLLREPGEGRAGIRVHVLQANMEGSGEDYVLRAFHCWNNNIKLARHDPWATGEPAADDVSKLLKCRHKPDAACNVSEYYEAQIVVVKVSGSLTEGAQLANRILKLCSDVQVLLVVRPEQYDSAMLTRLLDSEFQMIDNVSDAVAETVEDNRLTVLESLNLSA